MHRELVAEDRIIPHLSLRRWYYMYMGNAAYNVIIASCSKRMQLILIAAIKLVYKWASQPHNTWLKSIPVFVTGLCQRTWAVNMKIDVKPLWGICVFCTQQETFLNSVLWSSLGFIVKMIRKNRRHKKVWKITFASTPWGTKVEKQIIGKADNQDSSSLYIRRCTGKVWPVACEF